MNTLDIRAAIRDEIRRRTDLRPRLGFTDLIVNLHGRSCSGCSCALPVSESESSRVRLRRQALAQRGCRCGGNEAPAYCFAALVGKREPERRLVTDVIRDFEVYLCRPRLFAGAG